ncbi:MAG TPA: DNA-processing protein DprA, partial [Rhodobacteraceae bacterium]|nr:DNA-processing protein DprA [Paracoccaceae bacterium]
GTRMARKLANELGAAGYGIVSGLARGIDTAAHVGALDSGTIAVMAGGVDVIYPAENASLAQEIAEKGLRLSEQPMGLRPIARHFPQRNRIVSGLCSGIVVVEAAARSGSLITARSALDQGREVFAVPGHPFDGRATGCNHLIRDGATLVRDAQDVVEVLACEPGADSVSEQSRPANRGAGREMPKPPALHQATRLHGEILARLSPSPVSEDQLTRDLDIKSAELAPALLNLELDGKIIRQPGGLLCKAV